MKRIFALVLAIFMLAALLCACGKKENNKKQTASNNPSSTVSSGSTLSSTPVVTPEPVKMAKAAKVSADGGLNIRSEPSTDADILGVAEDGSLLPLLKEKADDGWYEVEYEGETGYIYAEFAKPQDVTLAEYNRLRSSGGDTSSSSSASSEEPSSSDTDAKITSSQSSSSKASSNEDGE